MYIKHACDICQDQGVKADAATTIATFAQEWDVCAPCALIYKFLYGDTPTHSLPTFKNLAPVINSIREKQTEAT